MARTELTGFRPTIRKPDFIEARAIINAQEKNFDRSIVCYLNNGQETKTVIPSRHMRHGMEEELAILVENMMTSDFIQILDRND